MGKGTEVTVRVAVAVRNAMVGSWAPFTRPLMRVAATKKVVMLGCEAVAAFLLFVPPAATILRCWHVDCKKRQAKNDVVCCVRLCTVLVGRSGLNCR